MGRRVFQQRVEAIFKEFEVFSYRESRSGPDRRIKGLDDYRPWVEFDLRPLKRGHAKECCHVPLMALVKLSNILGTSDISVTGFDMGYDCRKCGERETDFIGYVLARGVKFP